MGLYLRHIFWLLICKPKSRQELTGLEGESQDPHVSKAPQVTVMSYKCGEPEAEQLGEGALRPCYVEVQIPAPFVTCYGSVSLFVKLKITDNTSFFLRLT